MRADAAVILVRQNTGDQVGLGFRVPGLGFKV